MMNADHLVTGGVYHVFNKSIAGYKIFSHEKEYQRMRDVLQYYKDADTRLPFSNTNRGRNPGINKLVEIVAYCLMHTHIHLILKQTIDNGISIFMGRVQNSYARFLNLKAGRKGPLWEGRFKRVLVEDDEQLLHLTRYIHLNPITAYLVDDPDLWEFSSYHEYLGRSDHQLCDFKNPLGIDAVQYTNFVKDHIGYQRTLKQIERVVLEEQHSHHC